MSNSPDPEFAPTDNIGPDQDAWMLLDGSMYACEGDRHDACAAWLIEHVVDTKDIPERLSTDDMMPSRAKLQFAGGTMVRAGRLVMNGKAGIHLTPQQVNAAESNHLFIYDSTGGEQFDVALINKAQDLLRERAQKIMQSDENYDDRVAKVAKRLESSMRWVEGTKYTPGMFKPRLYGNSEVEEIESMAHFMRAPIEKGVSLYYGDDPKGERAAMDALSEGYDFEINYSRKHGKYSRHPEQLAQAIQERYIPLGGGILLQVRLDHHQHDGQSQYLGLDYTQTHISAQLVTPEYISEHLSSIQENVQNGPRKKGNDKTWDECSTDGSLASLGQPQD